MPPIIAILIIGAEHFVAVAKWCRYMVHGVEVHRVGRVVSGVIINDVWHTRKAPTPRRAPSCFVGLLKALQHCDIVVS
jgi:hypothetical protein